MDSNEVLSPGQRIRPPGSRDLVSLLLGKLYGLRVVKTIELNSYDDRNYHVICEDSHENPHITRVEKDGYVLKIVNSLDSKKTGVIEAQNEMLIFLNQRGIVCPLPIKNLSGTYYTPQKLDDSDKIYVVKLLVFRPGELLHRVPITATILRNVGCLTARIDQILSGFSHPVYDDHETLWMMTSVPRLREFTFAVKNADQRQMAHEVISAFEEEVLQAVPRLEQGVIHGDLNEQNILVGPDGVEIAAIIDFGDSHRTCVVFELAINLCYMILQAGTISMGRHVVDGYQSIRRLTDIERKILKVSVCGRICQSLVMGAYSHLHEPGNEYLLSTQKSGWTLLKELWPLSQEEVLKEWGLLE